MNPENEHLQTIITWYNEVSRYFVKDPENQLLLGQVTALSSVIRLMSGTNKKLFTDPNLQKKNPTLFDKVE